jgi:peptidoglycan/LPS O-acetylase OafA/YrhL
MSSHINKGHPRFAELDGLRALAVVSVILFHCEIAGWFNAGFLGVDIFFTISGFIITAILVKDYRDNGDFSFRVFYFRRLKRLLPPVLALVVLAAFTLLISETAFAAFRADVPAALAYVSNWWQIAEKQSYFDTTPHVLKHLWSLAVEEQFYFVWPPIAYFSLKRFGPKSAGMLALLLAAASTAWMWYRYDPAIDASTLNGLYLGTDTHAMGLFAGAALACFWDPWSPRARDPLARWSWRIAALCSLGGLGYMIHTLTPTDPFVYRGGFLVVAVLTAVLAYCTMSDRRFFVSRLLRTDLAQWLGSRSYSLYLVHWLVFVWIRLLGYEDFSAWAVLGGALAAVAVLSELMYQCVEVTSKRFNPQHLDNRRMAVCVLAYTAAAWTILGMTLADRGAQAPMLAGPNGEPARAPVQAAAMQPPVAAAPSDEPSDPDEMIAGGEDVFAIGDSVLLGARGHLSKTIPGIRVDADVGRQASQGLKVVKEWRRSSGKASTILLHLGTNGYINEAQFRELLGELADRKAVIVINVRANRRWMAPNNEMIARLAPQFPNVRVIDWHALADGRPEYFVKDGIHLTTKGMRALTSQIKAATGGAVIIPAERDTMLAKGNKERSAPAAAPKAAESDKRRPEAKEASTVAPAAPAEKAGEEAAAKPAQPVQPAPEAPVPTPAAGEEPATAPVPAAPEATPPG